MVLRRDVNIVITGTPGTGKSSHAELLKSKIPELSLVDVKKVIEENNCVIGYDDERKSQIVDEDKVVDAIEDQLEKGGLIIDWHVCDAFPENLIDLVVVLRTETQNLYDRLKERNYAENKITENIDAEIMEVVLNDAREQYDEMVIVPLDSNSTEDMDTNIDRISQWYKHWKEDHPNGLANVILPASDSSDSE